MADLTPELTDQIYTFLAGREGKADETLYFMMQMYRRMADIGFDYKRFLTNEQEAQAEGDRFLLYLRRRKEQELAEAQRIGKPFHARRRGVGRNNYVKNLKALCRMRGYKDTDWEMSRQAPAQHDVYTLPELRRLIHRPYSRSEHSRLKRALVAAHLVLGWRVGELAPLEDGDVDAATCTVFLRHPEKGNPQRRLPVESYFFEPDRAFTSWLSHRPVAPSNPHAVWTYTDHRGAVRTCTKQKLASFLAQAGREAGVRANCVRGRHTRCAALLAQGRQLAFVKMFMGHGNIATLTAYIEMVDAGLLAHLKSPTWFARAYNTPGDTTT